MVKVAVVGGTSSVGRYIVEAIAATKKHELVILSSRPPPITEFAGLVYEHKTVDYTNAASLKTALAGVHTVVLAHWNNDPQIFIASSVGVLDAAVAVGAKRFVPSEFSTLGRHDDALEAYRPKAVIADAVRKSGLEFTLFECGFFMNYLGTGSPGLGYMGEYRPLVDVENCKASFVGDGQYSIVQTSGEDVGKFVAASLDLDKWPEVSRMAGDRKTVNEILALAEEIRGKKFEVTHLTVDEMTSQYVPNPPLPIVNLVNQALLDVSQSPERWAYADANLNKLCPNVKPIGIEEFLRKWWTKA